MLQKSHCQTIAELCQDIPRLRKIKGLSQTDIADKLGVTPGTVSRWERSGFRTLKLRDFVKIVKIIEQKKDESI